MPQKQPENAPPAPREPQYLQDIRKLANGGDPKELLEEVRKAAREPREPAAREGQVAKTSGQLITGILNEWIRCFISSPSAEQIRWALEQTEAYSAELRAQITHLQQFPPALNDVLKRAEAAEAERDRLQQANDKEECTPCECCASTIAERTRAEAAEARIRELETADIQRAKDITRLTIERDDFEQRLILRGQAHQQTEQELEASERSLLQARAEMKTRLERALADAKDINGYAVKDGGGLGERLLKVAGHTTGMIIRLERELASTSAPEGD